MSSRQSGILLYLFLVFCLIKGIFWAFFIPDFQAPDEEAHFSYVQFWVENGFLPRPPYENLGQGLSRQLEVYLESIEFESTRFNPLMHEDFSSKEPIDLSNYDSRPTQEYWGYSYPPLYYLLQIPTYVLFADHIHLQLLGMRLISVLLSSGVLLLIFLMSRKLFKNELLALSTSLLVALWPPYAFLASTVNNDRLLEFAFAGFFYGLSDWHEQGRTRWNSWILMAAILVASLTKPPIGYLVFPFLAIFLLFQSNLKTYGRSLKWIGFLLSILTLVLGADYIYGYILSSFDALELLNLPFWIQSAKLYFSHILLSFVGGFGWLDTFSPLPFFFIFLVLALCSAIGLTRFLLKTSSHRSLFLTFTLQMIFTAVVYFSIFVMGRLTGSEEQLANQGRYYFILWAPLSLIFLQGFTSFFSFKKQPILPIFFFISFLIFFYLFNLFEVILPRYYF